MTKNLSRAEKVIAFIEQYLVVPEGAHVGRPVKLRPWQKEIIREIYDSPTRRAIVSLARKNGKTALAAMLVLVHLVGPEARRNGHIFSAAQSRDQAAIVFGLAAKMVRMSAELNEIVTVRDSGKELVCSVTGARFRALSAESTTAYGLSPVFTIHDELGQVRGPRSELYDALETAAGAAADPLSIIGCHYAPVLFVTLQSEVVHLSTMYHGFKRFVRIKTRDSLGICIIYHRHTMVPYHAFGFIARQLPNG